MGAPTLNKTPLCMSRRQTDAMQSVLKRKKMRFTNLLGYILLLHIVLACSSANKMDKSDGTEWDGVVDTIIIDPSVEYQSMDGFGASDAWRCQFVGVNWPLEKREGMADLLFSQELKDDGSPKGIGLSIWRFCIGAGSAEQGTNSGIDHEWRRAECFLNSDGSYDWSKQMGQQWFLEAA